MPSWQINDFLQKRKQKKIELLARPGVVAEKLGQGGFPSVRGAHNHGDWAVSDSILKPVIFVNVERGFWRKAKA